MISPPVDTDYWVEGLLHENSKDSHGLWVPTDIELEFISIEEDKLPFIYQNSFKPFQHFNYFTRDEEHGPLVVSIKIEHFDEKKQYNVLLRLVGGTLYKEIPEDSLPPHPTPEQIAESVESWLTIKHLQRVLIANAPDNLNKYDIHTINNQHKIGVLFQRNGQNSEEDILSNQTTSVHFEEFLKFLGECVPLKDFKGFSGGLDTKHNLTGTNSIYTTFQGREIMFHVSTMLPYDDTDPQQIQRKRHIGNDIIAIIFQEEGSMYAPGTFKSHFLMVIFVIQPVKDAFNQTLYKVSLIANEDCANFNPLLPHPPVYLVGEEFRIFFFTKLINAELSAMKSPKLFKLDCRTRSQLLENLMKKIDANSPENKEPCNNTSHIENRGYSNSLRRKINTMFKGKREDFDSENNDLSFFTCQNNKFNLNSNPENGVNSVLRNITVNKKYIGINKLSLSEPPWRKYACHNPLSACYLDEVSNSVFYATLPKAPKFPKKCSVSRQDKKGVSEYKYQRRNGMSSHNIYASLDEKSFTSLVLDSLPEDATMQCRSSLGFSDFSISPNSPKSKYSTKTDIQPHYDDFESNLNSDLDFGKDSSSHNYFPNKKDPFVSLHLRSKSLVLPEISILDSYTTTQEDDITLLKEQVQQLHILNRNLLIEKQELKSEVIRLQVSNAELSYLNNDLVSQLDKKYKEIDELNLDLQLFAYFQNHSN